MVPTIVIALTFCASRDTRISYGWRLLLQRYFRMSLKLHLASALGNQKRKLGVTTHFSDIIKLEFGKERHTLLCIFKIFRNIVD